MCSFNHKTGAEDVHFTLVSSHSELDNDADHGKYENNNNGPTKRNSHSGGECFSVSDLESSHSELEDDAHNDKHENSNHEPTKAHSRSESISGSYSEFSSVSGDDLTDLEMIMVKEVKAGAEVRSFLSEIVIQIIITLSHRCTIFLSCFSWCYTKLL